METRLESQLKKGVLEMLVLRLLCRAPGHGYALMERMKGAGYAAFLAQNPETKMYRVIISTFDTKQEAAVSRDDFKAKYPNDEDFQKAWILQRAY